jgi:hypothetical protein
MSAIERLSPKELAMLEVSASLTGVADEVGKCRNLDMDNVCGALLDVQCRLVNLYGELKAATAAEEWSEEVRQALHALASVFLALGRDVPDVMDGYEDHPGQGGAS